ncbi:MAG: macro domain-containing protein [Nostoc sp.]|uniref:macro domain-containing protein n=1 Tax=unclassified Nostoc TaxID=2593658 RepID=UPI0025E90D5D|nr:macro domain-containing protein [Nostoc sp. NMS9]
MIEYKGCQYCVHFRPDGTCPAFDPDTIPLPIVSGQIKHIKPVSNQENTIVYEPVKKSIIYRVDTYRTNNKLMRRRIEIIQGDIKQQNVDAIVNAANEALIAGGGVSGSIHNAAGLGLEEECLKLGGCQEEKAKITKGYNLPAKWVIHTVSPVWEGGNYGEHKILAQCYRSCFAFVEPYKINTIAFPSISTGAYDFPIEIAAKIAIRETRLFLEQNTFIDKVFFICFEKDVYECYTLTLEKIIPEDF